ncbi:hypothetical protein KC357_g154 [Hortaea werneckii]|nr:hypothetical protein KC357_g154 [Hortaea werneckii]
MSVFCALFIKRIYNFVTPARTAFIRTLPSEEMAALSLYAFVHHGSKCPAPSQGHNGQLPWGMHHCASLSGMDGFVVNPQARRWTGCAEVVDGYPGQNLVVCPGVGICPIVKLFQHPRQQTDWTVCQTIAKRLRLSALLETVTRSFFREPFAPLESFPVSLGAVELAASYCFSPKSCFLGPSLQPKLGSDGATTWKETPLPAMYEDQWYSIWGVGWLVKIVDVQFREAVDANAFVVVRKGIELCFLSPPVKPLFPVLDQSSLRRPPLDSWPSRKLPCVSLASESTNLSAGREEFQLKTCQNIQWLITDAEDPLDAARPISPCICCLKYPVL